MSDPSGTRQDDTEQDGTEQDHTEQEWLTVPELVELTGQPQGRVRRLIEERHLLAVRRAGVLVVPAAFLRDGAPLPELRGTVTVLGDAGYDDDEAVAWLLEEDDGLGAAPIEALRAGRKSEVRRVAQSLGF